MKRRIVAVIGAITLAAMGTAVLLAYVNTAEDRALAGERTVDVLVVGKPIDQGTAAKDIQGKVHAEKVPAKVRADGAVTDLASLGDRVAAQKLVPGEQIVAGRFVNPQDLEAVGQVAVPDGYHQLTVALAPERAVGGLIKPGSHVGVVASFKPFDISNDQPVNLDGFAIKADGQAPNATHMILHKVLVTAVQTSQTTSNTENANQAPSGNVLVTLALKAPQVEKVVFTAEFGTLYLSYEPTDAPEDGTRVFTRAVIYQ